MGVTNCLEGIDKCKVINDGYTLNCFEGPDKCLVLDQRDRDTGILSGTIMSAASTALLTASVAGFATDNEHSATKSLIYTGLAGMGVAAALKAVDDFMIYPDHSALSKIALGTFSASAVLTGVSMVVTLTDDEGRKDIGGAVTGGMLALLGTAGLAYGIYKLSEGPSNSEVAVNIAPNGVSVAGTF